LLARGRNYIDAVVDFCSRRGIEVETMTPNRFEPAGYEVVRVRFKDGRPDDSYKKFLTGFWISGQHRAEVWGRPAALGTGHLIGKPPQEPCRARRGTARGRMA
jgi:hypothetical protein